MLQNMSEPIEISMVIFAPIKTVWSAWMNPKDIVQWHVANDDWICMEARNNLRVGGEFSYTMATKDGGLRFDFSGKHTRVRIQQLIESVLDNGRHLEARFKAISPQETLVVQAFEPETSNPLDMQEAGWRGILKNFQKYVEAKAC